MYFGRACALLFPGAHKSNTTENPAVRQLLRFKVGSKYEVLNPALLPRVARTLINLIVVLFGRLLKNADVEDRKLRVCNLQERYRAHTGQYHLRMKIKHTSHPILRAGVPWVPSPRVCLPSCSTQHLQGTARAHRRRFLLAL